MYPKNKKILFLQGPTSLFFRELAKGLKREGHSVSVISYCCGDFICNVGAGIKHHRANSINIGNFLKCYTKNESITDIVLIGAHRPVHAIQQLSENIRVHVFDEGYFRPDLVTLEFGGVNSNSLLPKEREWFREACGYIHTDQKLSHFPNSTFNLALNDLLYHIPNLLNPILYSKYKTHRPYISGVEFYGWAKRFSKIALAQRADTLKVNRLLNSKTPFYFMPLQLDSDAQITHHSSFSSNMEALEKVVISFSQYAPHNSTLLIKNHPLDTGFVNYKKQIRDLCQKIALDEGRLVYVESGHLPSILSQTRGTVTINSTVGTSALFHKSPTIALGDAIYDLQGLTFQGGIDEFWEHSEIPDQLLFESFKKVVIATTQVNGSFYTRKGIQSAVEKSVPILIADKSPLEMLIDKVGYL